MLVRHSKPEIKRDKPASSWKLGEVGRSRSELLAARLRGFSPQVIWSSTEPEAVETAEIVADAFGVPACSALGLGEHDRRDVPFFETRDEFEKAVEHFFREPARLVLGTETAEQALGRFTSAIDQIISAGHDDSVVVTHGTVMTLYRGACSQCPSHVFLAPVGIAVLCRTDPTRYGYPARCRKGYSGEVVTAAAGRPTRLTGHSARGLRHAFDEG